MLQSSSHFFFLKVQLATDAGLVIFCWGDDNNDKKTIKKLKAMGLHAVIYDKLDEYTTKDVKVNIIFSTSMVLIIHLKEDITSHHSKIFLMHVCALALI